MSCGESWARTRDVQVTEPTLSLYTTHVVHDNYRLTPTHCLGLITFAINSHRIHFLNYHKCYDSNSVLYITFDARFKYLNLMIYHFANKTVSQNMP